MSTKRKSKLQVVKAVKQWDMDEVLEVVGSYMKGSALESVKEDAIELNNSLKHVDKDSVIMSDLFVSVQAGDVPVIVNTHDKRVSFMINEEEGRLDYGYESNEGIIKFIEGLKENGEVTEVEQDEDTVKAIAKFLDTKDIEYHQIGTSIIWNIMDQRDKIVVVDTMYKTYGYSDATKPDESLKLDNTFNDWKDIPDLKRMNFHIV